MLFSTRVAAMSCKNRNLDRLSSECCMANGAKPSRDGPASFFPWFKLLNVTTSSRYFRVFDSRSGYWPSSAWHLPTHVETLVMRLWSSMGPSPSDPEPTYDPTLLAEARGRRNSCSRSEDSPLAAAACWSGGSPTSTTMPLAPEPADAEAPGASGASGAIEAPDGRQRPLALCPRSWACVSPRGPGIPPAASTRRSIAPWRRSLPSAS